ncbi:uncharacterized protein FOMMEDRAFT_142075 [Fomitiporia mediterranea MF3/22]|uniref:uncharacterized protein n=1 Tax=Fomitiporia mediterranea (strain MF3/22) TaxID=694068 RepID=UPI0004409610|nr:uncharacterized protein FOMMEDRAFT_142075 [Fomitiporia mediterranea MF3/22]EJD01460.1 hypothetical protein FOMMEDRAFT_142075 [Fomitiporia mediterranea MF3/22]
MGSITQLVSSLVVGIVIERLSDSDRVLCAFVIAWDSMSFQSARLIGLVVLGLDLGSLGVKRIERIAFWAVVGVIAILVILTNALEPGDIKQSYLVTQSMQQGNGQNPVLEAMGICYRQHKLAPSLPLSIITILLEVYVIYRFLDIIAPAHFPLRRRLDALFRDFRIIRGFSLLLFDLITMVPASVKTTYVGDSVPFSIAALIVLIAFNDYHPPLRVYGDIAPQIDNKLSQRPESQHLVRYRSLMPAPHPFSAAALSMVARQAERPRIGGYSGLMTTSSSDATLFGRPVSLSRTDALLYEVPRTPPLPPIPTTRPTKKPESKRPSRSPSKSRSRAGSHKTRTSSRSRKSQKSQRSHLVRPIVPKAELARQFEDSERSASSENTGVLFPRPHQRMPNRTTSLPLQIPPQAAVRSRRPSATESMVQTLASESVRYGSDILRPELGHAARDKMKSSASTRTQTPRTSTPRSHRTHHSESDGSIPEFVKRQSDDSWMSDRTIDTYKISRLVPPVPMMPTFNGGWPVPPSSIPAPKTNVSQYTRLGLPSGPRSLKQTTPPPPAKVSTPSNPVDNIQLSTTSRSTSVGVIKRVSSVRGPRMQFPPPRSRAHRI